MLNISYSLNNVLLFLQAVWEVIALRQHKLLFWYFLRVYHQDATLILSASAPVLHYYFLSMDCLFPSQSPNAANLLMFCSIVYKT